VHVVLAEAVSKELFIDTKEIISAAWYTPAEIPKNTSHVFRYYYSKMREGRV